MDRYKKIAMLMCSVGLILVLTGVTYSFFNYTRTGNLNNLGTGRIYFNSEQNGSLNITNVFPMTSSQAGEANLDTVTVGIVGDTTYANGEEFEIKLVDVANTINGKSIPINYIATYAATSGNSIGEESDTYWESRESKNADIYTLNETGKVEEGKQVLVGYIKNSATGINGTLTIKAYVDADRIAISDTYPSGEVIELNSNMTTQELNDCVSYLTSEGLDSSLQTGETLNAFCQGTGTVSGITFQNAIDQGLFNSSQMSYLESHNIINDLGENGTTSAWVNGRTVFTTSEWNSLSSTPISFKIRAESNEGIWVEEPSQGTIESCPNCKFIYTADFLWTTWNTGSQTPTELTLGYSTNYNDIVTSTGKNYFLGVVTNATNQITNAYACGIYNGTTPFCIEGTVDGANYSSNSSFINGSNLWNNTCTVESYYTNCGAWNGSSVSAYASSNGGVSAGVSYGFDCYVSSLGEVRCSESDGGE